jgi:CubicO group peptidase (beta-lactamase class C family)
VIAGVIVERAAGMPLLQFLREKVFTPLGMKSVANIDQETLADTEPSGYLRYSLGPVPRGAERRQGMAFRCGRIGCPTGHQLHSDHCGV